MGYSRRKEAWEIIEAIRDADRALGTLTLGDICARGVVTLNVACQACQRCGRYRVTRLIDRHGARMPLLELKALLSADCPKRKGSFYHPCGACFPGLP